MSGQLHKVLGSRIGQQIAAFAKPSQLTKVANSSSVHHRMLKGKIDLTATLKKIEGIANVAVIAASVLLFIVLIKSSLLPKTSPETGSAKAAPVAVAPDAGTNKARKTSIQTGMKIALPGVDFARNDRTLLLALSTTCHFCTESAGLYKKLEKERNSTTRLVAVLPQSAAAGREYLDKLGVKVDEVVQAQLNLIGVRGTPTLILIDHNGAVIDSWVGKLADTEEPRVIGRVREAVGA